MTFAEIRKSRTWYFLFSMLFVLARWLQKDADPLWGWLVVGMLLGLLTEVVAYWRRPDRSKYSMRLDVVLSGSVIFLPVATIWHWLFGVIVGLTLSTVLFQLFFQLCHKKILAVPQEPSLVEQFGASFMRILFRPLIPFENRPVDHSLLLVNGFIWAMVLVLFLAGEMEPSPALLQGACAGLLIGGLAVAWEMVWHQSKNAGGGFHLSYLPHTLNATILIGLFFSNQEEIQAVCVMVFAGYQLLMLAALGVLQWVQKKRFTWVEFFP